MVDGSSVAPLVLGLLLLAVILMSRGLVWKLEGIIVSIRIARSVGAGSLGYFLIKLHFGTHTKE